MEGVGVGLADDESGKKNYKASSRSRYTEDQVIGGIAPGCRIVWRMGLFGGVLVGRWALNRACSRPRQKLKTDEPGEF